MTDQPTTWSRKKKDPAPRGVFVHPSSTPKARLWAARFTCAAGHVHQERVGPLKSDAIRVYHDRRARALAQPGWCPATERQQERERAIAAEAAARPLTFAHYAEEWLARTIRPHRKPRTVEYYDRILALHLIPAFGTTPLTALQPADVRTLIAGKLSGLGCPKHEAPATACDACKEPLARNTVKNITATLRTILYQAIEDRLVPSNAAARLGKLFSLRHDPRQHVIALEPANLAPILRAAAKWYPDHELAVRTLFYTGIREGELLGLQWDDVDWPRNLIDLRRTVAFRKGGLIVNTPKSGKLRTIDVPASLIGRLRERRSIRQAEGAVAGVELSPWIFPAATEPAKPMNDAWFRDRVWRPLLEKAEVRHIRVHDARHTYASIMLRRGVTPAYVCKQLGHSSIQVTVDLYGHFIPGADRHHVEGLAQAIEAACAADGVAT